MIIEVEGQQVEVDDSFAKLSPDQQQAELQHIVTALKPPEASAPIDEATQAKMVNPLYPTLTGVIAGEIGGPMINKATEGYQASRAARLGTPPPAAAPTTAPGTTHTPYNPRGSSVEQSVENWRTYSEAQNEAAKKVRQESALHKKYPGFSRAGPPPATVPTPPPSLGAKIGAAIPGPIKDLGAAIGAATQSGVAPWLGRAVAGAGAGFQGADAYNRAQQGDVSGATISGIGALGSAASLIPHPVTRIGGTAIGLGAEALNMYLDELKKKSQGVPQAPMGNPMGDQTPQMAAGGAVQYFANAGTVKNVAGGLQSLAKKTAKAYSNADLGKVFSQSPFTASAEQTVTNPLRNAFPGIYKRPDVIAAEAAARVAPESEALKRLFGVTRDDLYQMGKGRVGNISGVLPGAAANPKGSKAAIGVMNPQNEQRLLDVLSESEKHPELVRGMDPWYIMDPAYKRLEELLGPEEAIKKYKQFNIMTGMASPGSDVLTEMNRGTAANFLATQGRFNDFVNYGGKQGKPGTPSDMGSVLGHPYHMTSQALPMKQYLDTGEIQMSSPKVPMYIDASGVPQTGFQTDMPVGDAHWSRAVGLADTRGKATRKGKEIIPGASVTNPEMSQLGPWWQDKIASQVGLESVPAQARAWGAFSPQTGVESPIGAPKLELLSMKIMEAANRYGVSPEQARDMILKGEGYAGKKQGGLV